MKKKPAITIDEYLKSDQKALYNLKYKSSLEAARGDDPTKLIEDFELNVGKFSLRTKIKNHTWVKKGRPASSAISWLSKIVYKNPNIYRYNKRLLYQGGLFYFEYKNPKYKNTKRLPYFDKYPLVLSLGPIITKQGVRNIGFNLHMLPPKVRIIAVCGVFEIYKSLYRYQIFYKQFGPVRIKYTAIVRKLEKFGVDFSIRMYIPARMNNIAHFRYNEWHNAVFIPSRSYHDISANNLIKEWTKFLRRKQIYTSPKVNWNNHI